MKIEKYSFGKMVIDNTEYKNDLLITPENEIHSWWRKTSHNVILEDLEEIFKLEPRGLIIGTGFYGLMKISKEIKEYCSSKKIELIYAKTGRSIKTYNASLSSDIAAAFHLTC